MVCHTHDFCEGILVEARILPTPEEENQETDSTQTGPAAGTSSRSQNQ